MRIARMRFAIFAQDEHGKTIVLPERYDTPRQAKEAWGYACMNRNLRPLYIETVPCECPS